MGILATRWEADHAGHRIAVARNELTKGFTLEWDGVEIARRTWSFIGLGELCGTADLDGEPVEVRVALRWNGLGGEGNCVIAVNDQPVEDVRRVR